MINQLYFLALFTGITSGYGEPSGSGEHYTVMPETSLECSESMPFPSGRITEEEVAFTESRCFLACTSDSGVSLCYCGLSHSLH